MKKNTLLLVFLASAAITQAQPWRDSTITSVVTDWRPDSLPISYSIYPPTTGWLYPNNYNPGGQKITSPFYTINQVLPRIVDTLPPDLGIVIKEAVSADVYPLFFNQFNLIRADEIKVYQTLSDCEHSAVSMRGMGVDAWYGIEKVWVVGLEETTVLVPKAIIFGIQVFRLVKDGRGTYKYVPDDDLREHPPKP